MAVELKPGTHIVCNTCHARTGKSSADTGCDTGRLDGIRYRQPHLCPLPRVVYASNTSQSKSPYQMLRNQLGK